MKIIRDGQEFELTCSEIEQAHREYKLDCMIEDVKNVYEPGEYDIDLSEEQLKEIAEMALHNLGKNDGYYESYWMSVECTLEQYIDDKNANND
jgi:hypothetical protein